jgi:predicted small lipoprotein YifL
MHVYPIDPRSARRRASRLLVASLLALSLGLAGCGNKGPLKLPDSTIGTTQAR